MTRTIKASVAVLLAVSFVLAGCGFNISLGAKETPTTQVRATPEVTTAPVTTEPVTTEPVTTTGSAGLSTTLYKNANGAFQFYPPEGWTNTHENDFQVTFTSPDNATLITVDFTNTGYKLDAQSMEYYINGNEANLFSFNDAYSEISRDLHLDEGYGTVYKTFNTSNVLQKAETIYNQNNDVVFTIELWTDEAKWDGMVDLFNQVIDQVTWFPNQVTGASPYMLWDQFNGLDNAFSYYYYFPWYPTWDYSGETKMDTYTSPDGYAFTESLYFNDRKTEWNKGNAGQWALDNLESYYAKNASDLKIDKDQLNEKGYEYLEWHTKMDEWVGVTIFYAEGTQIELLTVAWQKSYADVYESALRDIIGTFAAPAE
jgi:hypothetical protein